MPSPGSHPLLNKYPVASLWNLVCVRRLRLVLVEIIAIEEESISSLGEAMEPDRTVSISGTGQEQREKIIITEEPTATHPLCSFQS